MPEFLRCVKTLCSLYPFYKQALAAQTPSSPSGMRAGSFGASHLDSSRPNPRARSFLNSWTGHRRTKSTDDLDESVGGALSSIGGGVPEMPVNPFDKLEVIWTSLECWFDLILKEIQKLSTDKPQKLTEPTIADDDALSDTSQLAAAIILSAPPKRREVYLKQTSTSLSPPQIADEKKNWRRSWHAERYVRVTPLAEEGAEPEKMTPLPSFERSKSSEVSPSSERKNGEMP